MCSQLIQNVNISLEICLNVSGGGMAEPHGSLQGSHIDPDMDPIRIPIWILYGSICGSYMGPLYVNVLAADAKC